MKLTTFTINLYLFFIIIILLIIYFYYNSNKLESYVIADNNNSTTNTTNTININNTTDTTDINNTTDTTDINNTTDINTENTDKFYNVKGNESITLNDKTPQKMINEYIQMLSLTLNRFKNLDAPITINNKNKICDPWGNYDSGKYKLNDNQCLIVKGQKQRTCLSKSNLVSCSKYYDDGSINKFNRIDTDKILKTYKEKILINYDNLNKNIMEKNTNIYKILNELIDKRNLENQQLYFIDYNDNNIDDKQKIIDKSTEEFEKDENNINISNVNFSVLLEKNKNIDKRKNNYYKITLGLIITIIIMGILNFLFN